MAVPGGLALEEACAAVRLIADRLRVAAVALTAYDPAGDPGERIPRAAGDLLASLLAPPHAP
jgi:arginase family enzyme